MSPSHHTFTKSDSLLPSSFALLTKNEGECYIAMYTCILFQVKLLQLDDESERRKKVGAGKEGGQKG